MPNYARRSHDFHALKHNSGDPEALMPYQGNVESHVKSRGREERLRDGLSRRRTSNLIVFVPFACLFCYAGGFGQCHSGFRVGGDRRLGEWSCDVCDDIDLIAMTSGCNLFYFGYNFKFEEINFIISLININMKWDLQTSSFSRRAAIAARVLIRPSDLTHTHEKTDRYHLPNRSP